jgi:hypothetical protein
MKSLQLAVYEAARDSAIVKFDDAMGGSMMPRGADLLASANIIANVYEDNVEWIQEYLISTQEAIYDYMFENGASKWNFKDYNAIIDKALKDELMGEILEA